MNTVQLLILIAVVLVFLIIGLTCLYWYMSVKSKKSQKTETKNNGGQSEKVKKGTEYTKVSVFDFMEFDQIEDNMIIQDGGARYLMVIECEGINYDLMSEVEKVAVEKGFIQFLNILRHPIQLYTQTRTINIGHSIENYNGKVNEIKMEIIQKEGQLNRLLQSNNEPNQKQINDLKREIARLYNLYDYGVDVITNIEKMSLNRNVLRKHYYIIIPYYASELGVSDIDPKEKRNMIFSELYTRARAIVSTLFACSMKCRIMDSNELVELLYVAYNRDESEVYSVERALRAGYDELYSTAQDVLDKKIEALNRKAEEKAMELAKSTVDNILNNEKQKIIKKKEETFDDIIKEMAAYMVNENKQYIGESVAKEAVKQIKNTKEGEETDGENEEIKTRKSTRAV